jgi:hypothetical protein
MRLAFLGMWWFGSCAVACTPGAPVPASPRPAPTFAQADRPSSSSRPSAGVAQPVDAGADAMGAADGAPPTLAAPPPPPLPTEPAPRLAELQRRLRAVPDFASETIPPAARPLLADLRQTSIALIRTEVERLMAARGGSLSGMGDKPIEQAIEAAALAAGVDVTKPGSQEGVNGLWNASVTRSRANPRCLVIGFYFAVPCGSDGGYLVYDIATTPSRLLLAIKAPDADTIEPLFWDLAFAVPPPGDPKEFFFVATRITPWCQSAARQLQLLAFKPTANPDAPEVLIDVTVSQHLQEPMRLDVERDSILLGTHDGMQAETRRWKVRKGRAVLVAR